MRIAIASNIPVDRTLAMVLVNQSLGDCLDRLGYQIDYIFGGDVRRLIPWSKMAHINFALGVGATVVRRSRSHAPWDIVFASGSDGLVCGVWRRAFRPGKRPQIVGISHGLEHRLWQEFRTEQRLGRAYISPQHAVWHGGITLKLVELAIRSCDHMVCRANEDREYIIARGWKAASAVTHIPNGVEDRFFSKPPGARERSGLLFVGRWEWRKGMWYLVRAFARLKARYPDLTLTLVGTRLPANEVLAAFPAHLAQSVRVIPLLSGEELVAEYWSHHALIFPTLFEATAGVMLEAMAAGTPVVTTNRCGMREVITDGVDGLLVPARDIDALVEQTARLLDDPALRHRLGAAARERAQAYTWARIATQTAELFERLLHAPERSRGGLS